ncbi:MAG: hypothetical protein AAF657_08295 [Acidobacteriota bacterium]
MPRRFRTDLMRSLVVLCLFALPLRSGAEEISGDWVTAGSRPQAYEMGTDTEVSAVGDSSSTIRSIKKRINGFGTLMQKIPAAEYHGKRIRLSGFMKTEGVKDWACFWLRVDGHKRKKMLAFDNMKRRLIRGTREDWTQYRLVLDVADEAKDIAFGFLLVGVGQIWADGIELEVVGDDVPVTDMLLEP